MMTTATELAGAYVTRHAIVRYRQRVDRGATDEEALARITAAVENPREVWTHPSNPATACYVKARRRPRFLAVVAAVEGASTLSVVTVLACKPGVAAHEVEAGE